MRPQIQLVCLALVAWVALAKPSTPQDEINRDDLTIITRAYNSTQKEGNFLDIDMYVPDLSLYNFDNEIESVFQTGMWIYYDNINYNEKAGRVYFVHGVRLGADFPASDRNMASSTRWVGKKSPPNDDTLTLYTGTFFSGEEYYAENDTGVLDSLDQSASSLIITGNSSWTLYSGQKFSGDSVCVNTTDHDTGPSGHVLDFGIYPSMNPIGIKDNSIRSVRKGCASENVAPLAKVEYQFKAKNGAWGYADL